MNIVRIKIPAILFFFLIFQAHSNEETWRCPHLADFNNERLMIRPQDYSLPNWRDLKDLKKLNNIFEKIVEELAPRSLVIDPGGGYSFYGLELAKRGHRVKTINIQDFYRDYLENFENPTYVQDYLSQFSNKTGQASYGAILPIFRAAEILGISLPNRMSHWRSYGSIEVSPGPSLNSLCHEISVVSRMIRERMNQPELSNFERIPGFAQNALPTIPSNSAGALFDVYGAFFYSSNRWSLVPEYYRTLELGKRAVLVLPYPNDTVMVAKSRRPFYKVLNEEFPEIFEVISMGSPMKQLLVIKKGEPGALDAFWKRLRVILETETKFGENTKVHYPVVTLELLPAQP